MIRSNSRIEKVFTSTFTKKLFSSSQDLVLIDQMCSKNFHVASKNAILKNKKQKSKK